eukprot:CAMPEP_0117514600 /NCGR_PEP_ID=MMETSP0784-20121206/30152_1 /TAXON_ID=39447 /ORGANISM="" /LENGTH=104 /DNA_ID=CAMNT_0005310399 /DNA_START=490 /DNA_END=805 /DNA_ORIENTATION=-
MANTSRHITGLSATGVKLRADVVPLRPWRNGTRHVAAEVRAFDAASRGKEPIVADTVLYLTTCESGMLPRRSLSGSLYLLVLAGGLAAAVPKLHFGSSFCRFGS